MYYNITMLNYFLIVSAAKKFLASREGAAEGGFKGGIPPRPRS